MSDFAISLLDINVLIIPTNSTDFDLLCRCNSSPLPLYPKSLTDLYPILDRIRKYASTELELYSKGKNVPVIKRKSS